MGDELTHLDERGHAHMVDVGGKPVTRRTATASAFVRTGRAVRDRIADGGVPKGDVLAVARIAGIMAAKRTADLLPLCHPLPLDAVSVGLTLAEEGVSVLARVATSGRTGVEMEALTAASVAALTVYDMCKALERGIIIESVQLETKAGGASGTFVRAGHPAAADSDPSERRTEGGEGERLP
jgi:cyclic pyranopterin phosphate synthase